MGEIGIWPQATPRLTTDITLFPRLIIHILKMLFKVKNKHKLLINNALEYVLIKLQVRGVPYEAENQRIVFRGVRKVGNIPELK